MPWWAWLVLGMLLLAGEMAVPSGFYLLFFGIGALLVGIVGLAGLELAGWIEWLLFSASSVAAVALLRPRIVGRLRHAGPGIEDTLVGEIAVASEAIEPGAMGRGELRGSVFELRNAGPTRLVPGQRARVEKVEGLVLDVRSERPSGDV